MDAYVCRSLLDHLVEKGLLKTGSAPADVAKWLGSLELPDELAAIMQHHWVLDHSDLDKVSLISAESIRNDEFTPTLLRYKMLNVGHAINGDWFVIDFGTDKCTPGFVSHEEWSGFPDETEDPHDYFAPLANTLEAFLIRVDEGRFMPIDYYEAQDWNEHRDEE